MSGMEWMSHSLKTGDKRCAMIPTPQRRPRGPSPHAAHRKVRAILLNDTEYAIAKAYGCGNASSGIRELLVKTLLESRRP
jgi:hypothetical protein